jgi:DivIVA domain-containing protein
VPLTPQDVSNKRFTPVKGRREGYDMGEVDQFLDEVEAELGRLIQENNDLREGKSVAPATETPAPAQTAAPAAAVAAPAAEKPAAPAAPTETIKVTTAAEASSAATRLLELATRNADELVGEARQEATTIVGDARAEAERLTAQSKEQADRVEADARTRAQLLETETNERRAQLFGDLESEKRRLSVEVDDLRSFEREYRARLKTYFSQQLAALDSAETPAADGAAAGAAVLDGQGNGDKPSRLQSLLGHGDDSTS